MPRFKLLAGQHIAADKNAPKLDHEGKPTGRFENRTYTKGDVVENDADLVARFGAGKFAYADAADSSSRIAELEAEVARLRAQAQVVPTARGPALMTPGEPTAQQGPAKAPGGQVSTGVQGDVGAANAQLGAQQGQGQDDFSAESLEEWTVADLRDLAAEEEIDLRGATRKDEIIATIRQARRG